MRINVRKYLICLDDEIADIQTDPGNLENISDMVRPVGTCYETSDANFDPNEVWAGTWTKVNYTYLESIGSGSSSSTIGITNGSSKYISASVPSGNTFLCWFNSGATDTWCGKVYTPYETTQSSAGFWVGSYWPNSGTNSFHGRFLYYKKVTKSRWQRTA